MPFLSSCSLSSAPSASGPLPSPALLKDDHLLPRLSAALGPAPPDPFLSPWPVRSLKQILLSTEEDSSAGPPQDRDEVPGGAPGPAHTQEIEENLLSLEVALRQLEVCLQLGTWAGCGRKGILHL